jgi:peptidyl-prolyl cis-trans isomerase B (cyclophilin B)
MPSKSRDRHLAKNAERRRLERTRAKRSKQAALGVGGVIAAVLLILVGIGILSRDSQRATEATPSPSVSAPGGSSSPTKIGTVTPQGSPADTVACGADVPAAAAKPKPQFDRAPTPDEVLKKDTTYTAVIETSCGTIKVELDDKAAPQTVASFVFLAEQGYFDGQFVTRVVDSIDVVQAGDPTGTGGAGRGMRSPTSWAPRSTTRPERSRWPTRGRTPGAASSS